MNETPHVVRSIEIVPDPLQDLGARYDQRFPASAYWDPRFLEREKEAIFYRSWLYAGALEELAEPGDFVTARALDQSIIVIRGKDRELRGFYNVCQHRAHELLKGRGNARVITCPYHAWSYHADGALRTARGLEKQPGFDGHVFCLKPVRVELFAGKLVFFNLDPAAEPLATIAAGLPAELVAEIPSFDSLTLSPGGISTGFDVNWKVAVDNFLECYHCGPAHPTFGDILDMSRWKTAIHDIWSSQAAPLAPGHRKPYPYPVSEDAPNRQGRFWWLWPTTVFSMMPGSHGCNVSSFVPSRVDRTERWGHRFGLPGAPVDEGRAAYGRSIVGPEDTALLESVQRGLGSRGYTSARFVIDPGGGEMTEAAAEHFHRLVARALASN